MLGAPQDSGCASQQKPRCKNRSIKCLEARVPPDNMQDHGKLVCAILLLAVLHSAVARVFVFDDGQPEYGDLAMVASSPWGRAWQPARAAEAEPEAAASGGGGSGESGDRVRRDHHAGVTGPVHTFVKTDKHAHFKWGVRHHVGHEYAG